MHVDTESKLFRSERSSKLAPSVLLVKLGRYCLCQIDVEVRLHLHRVHGSVLFAMTAEQRSSRDSTTRTSHPSFAAASVRQSGVRTTARSDAVFGAFKLSHRTSHTLSAFQVGALASQRYTADFSQRQTRETTGRWCWILKMARTALPKGYCTLVLFNFQSNNWPG